MPTYNQATITNAGLKLLGSANGGTDTITYTRMVFFHQWTIPSYQMTSSRL